MPSRRDFLSLAALPAFTAPNVRERIVGQTYVFSQEAQRRGIKTPEIAREMFAAFAEAGIRRVELMETFTTPASLDAMAAEGVSAPVVYTGSVMHEQTAANESIARIVKLAATMKGRGLKIVNTNPSPKRNRELKTDAELRVQAASLTRLARELRRHSVKLMVHHHDPEMRDNAREWRHIVAHTDPRIVHLCVDVHWAWTGGQDPLALIRESGKRLLSLHLRNSVNRVWSESLGDGDVDYRAIAAELRRLRVAPLLTIELAWQPATPHTRSLAENLRLSRQYIEKVFA